MSGKGEGSGFDALMAQMGVRPLKERTPPKGAASPPGKPPVARSTKPAARPGPPARDAGPPAAPAGPPAAPAGPPAAPAARVPSPAESSPAEPSPAEPSPAEPSPAGPPPGADTPAVATGPLGPLLHEHGLRGPSEADDLLRALADARLGQDLLDRLGPLDPEELRAFLRRRVLLLGGCEDCPTPRGQAVLRVPRERCGVCAGRDLRALRRRFLDLCLVSGRTRLLLCAPGPVLGPGLLARLQEPRLSIQALPLDQATWLPAEAERGRAQVWIQVGALPAGIVPPTLSRVQVEPAPLGPLLEAIVEGLRALDG